VTTIAPPSTTRLLAGIRGDGVALSLDEHLALHGPLSAGRDLVAIVEASGLRGRGGAGFPTGRKLRAVAERGGRRFVVVNAAESEPASVKDRALLRVTPHLVLDGAVAAARAVGAREVIVALSTSAGSARSSLLRALRERSERGHDRGITFHGAEVPPDFVAGEETAVVKLLNGGEALPAFRPPRPHERGVDRRPTVVQNAETLAHVALVARHGAAWFRTVGTADEPGTALVTVSGSVARPGVYEVALGTPLARVLDAAGGATTALSSVVAGGYHGGFVSAAELEDLDLSDASLRPAGAALGARVLFALPRTACGLREASEVVAWLARESAGQCGPCSFGLAAVARALAELHAGDASARARIERWLGQVRGRGACHHPDGAARFAASALAVFADDVDAHAERPCTAIRRAALLPLST
jgi:NADH:ubiquinone oxidoreductase subunit F (NADH-binding)